MIDHDNEFQNEDVLSEKIEFSLSIKMIVSELTIPIDLVGHIAQVADWEHRPRFRELCKSFRDYFDRMVDPTWWESERLDVHKVRQLSLCSVEWLEMHTGFLSATIDIGIRKEVSLEVLPMLYTIFVSRPNAGINGPRSIIKFVLQNCNISLAQRLYTIHNAGFPSWKKCYKESLMNTDCIECCMDNFKNMDLCELAENVEFIARQVVVLTHQENRERCFQKKLIFATAKIAPLLKLLDERNNFDWSLWEEYGAIQQDTSTFELHKYIFPKLDKGSIRAKLTQSHSSSFKSQEHAMWVYDNFIKKCSLRSMEDCCILLHKMLGKNGILFSPTKEYLEWIEIVFREELREIIALMYKTYPLSNVQLLSWMDGIVELTESDVCYSLNSLLKMSCCSFMFLYKRFPDLDWNGYSNLLDGTGAVYVSRPFNMTFLRWYRNRFPHNKITIRGEDIRNGDLSEWKSFIKDCHLGILHNGETITKLDLPHKKLNLIWKLLRCRLTLDEIEYECFCKPTIKYFEDPFIPDIFSNNNSLSSIIWLYNKHPEMFHRNIKTNPLTPSDHHYLWFNAKFGTRG